ncbi:riboflavin synthase [Leuconostoc pseudomesenteroides]|uniref:riboflavin synthase n=1 Tax=Leuconostoc pseudomesenteroides TaxID=33968 RepID=UPI00280AF977|nr:riboflavin synthase [Leuconostoc pseudomesenteroides]
MMFTGITQAKGKVEQILQKNSHEVELKIATVDAYFNDSKVGDSIMVDGVCLTITKVSSHSALFDIMVPTFNTTTIRYFEVGTIVNLEKAILVTERFDGHFVLGHVDGIAKVVRIEKISETILISFQPIEPTLMKQIISKGSISISGVSLTVIQVKSTEFQVGLIPVTLKNTNLSELTIGKYVNLETDILAKYITQRI